MSNKVKRVLVLLLIILKETGPTTACSSSCPSDCDCRSRGLSSVPQDLPTNITRLDLENNVFLSGFLGVVAGLFLLGIVLFARYMYKRRTTNPPAGPGPSVVFSNTNTTASVTTSSHDKSMYDISHADEAEYDDVATPGRSHARTGHRLPSPPPRNGAGQQVHYQNGSVVVQTDDADTANQYEPLRWN
ncbi:Hypp5514 [Branchiostoma lanceolatum]|uniref:Hypp5514 protein n=1 Tax=Branchiostoma lanceolatum TaxID=7740 RepID=A0A8J9YL64_BRALA|nr:Hypp5514 [Branchiostoma lanceolatum]